MKGLNTLKPSKIEPVDKFARFYDDEERKVFALLREKGKKF